VSRKEASTVLDVGRPLDETLNKVSKRAEQTYKKSQDQKVSEWQDRENVIVGERISDESYDEREDKAAADAFYGFSRTDRFLKRMFAEDFPEQETAGVGDEAESEP
jgi:hypothetical protein